MPWVSNRTPHDITVSITKTSHVDGSDGDYTVKPKTYYAKGNPAAESTGTNYWVRYGPETLKVVVDGKEKTFQVEKDDHVNIYIDCYEIMAAKWGTF